MFARALFISILLHLLFFGLSEARLFSLFSRPPVPPPEPSRLVINLVKPLSTTATVGEESLVLTARPAGAKTVRQGVQDIKPGHEPNPPVNERLTKEEGKGPVSPARSSLPSANGKKIVTEDYKVLPSLPAETPPVLEPSLAASLPDANPAGNFPVPEGTPAIAEEEPESKELPVDEETRRGKGATIPEDEASGEPGAAPAPFLPAVSETATQAGVDNQVSGGVGDRPAHPSVTPGNVPSTGPVQAYHQAPVYPRQARRQGWEGTVCLEALINREGNVINVAITASSGYELLDQAARKAVEKWRYTWPVDEPPNEYLLSIKITFQLEE